MQDLSGVIWVDDLMQEAKRRRAMLNDWLEHNARRELRREEEQLLKQWWQANETDRPEIVTQHKEVFARIRANRRRAHQIARQERALVDAAMRRQGYVVRTGNTVPRYVRPSRR